MHITNFFYENGIPFNAANSRSYKVMVESIYQFGPGLKPPTFHDLRMPLLKKSKEETEKLREKHDKAWRKYGCTLMIDGWTDRRGRHLINFLVNSPEGTIFLGSVDASGESHDGQMLDNLLEKLIKDIGEKNAMQVVFDNGSNYKLAGGILEIRLPEDIGKIPSIKKSINQARRCTTFIYRHGRVLYALREKTNGMNLVRTGATRFATAFVTLQSLKKHRPALRLIFTDLDWDSSKLSKTENDGDERPALAEVAYVVDFAKTQVKKAFGSQKVAIQNKIVKIVEERWSNQIGKPLYGAALFLNPGKYFHILEKDST
ncbi:uncharacterized protein LOC141690823 [Apium graveolens]|uniref:uncharacterized protein LOC141690823 n=1 Tax=Apium graveolens TaxID=4045 RepID=UPI003D7B6289